MPFPQPCGNRRIVSAVQPDQKGRHRCLSVFHIPGQNYDQTVTALSGKPLKGDTVRNAAVQIPLPADFHRAGYHRHGAGSPQYIHLFKYAVDLHIFRLAAVYVGNHGIKRNTGTAKRLVVEGIQPTGNFFIGVSGAHDIALPQKRQDSHIRPIAVESLIVPDHAAFLRGKIVYPEQCPGGNTCHAVGLNSFFQKHIQNTGGIHAPHGARLPIPILFS